MHREIDPLGADDAVAAGAVLLDVREVDEFAAGHAPSARNLPLSVFDGVFSDLPTDRAVICVCRSGGRSATAADALVASGYDAVNLVGGMHPWAKEGLPVVTDAGGSGVVA